MDVEEVIIPMDIEPELIRFKFHGRDEAVKIVNTGGDLVEYLTGQASNCPLINSEVKFVKELGKGAAGAPAWLINIHNAT